MTTVIFSDKKKGIIDFEFLNDSYKSGNLQGADVFAQLFKLDIDNNSFKDEPFNMKIFIDFDIKQNQWYNLYYFLKKGKIQYEAFPVVADKSIEIAIELSYRLGGIPKLDEYSSDLKEIVSKL